MLRLAILRDELAKSMARWEMQIEVEDVVRTISLPFRARSGKDGKQNCPCPASAVSFGLGSTRIGGLSSLASIVAFEHSTVL